MPEYTLKYGRGEIRFSIDPKRIKAELKINPHPVLPNPEDDVRKALRSPIGTGPLKSLVKPGEKVAIIVNDPTRVARSSVFLPVMVDELNDAGVPDDDIRIVFSLGTHRDMTREEMVGEVGTEIADRIKMFNPNAYDKTQFDYFGKTSRNTPVYFNKLVTEVDRIICTGSIVFHYAAGFGGGRKAMLPGVASYETIRNNHSYMMDPGSGLGQLDGNPMHEDMIEGVEMLRPAFLLNVVLNEKKEILGVFAGDYIKAHRAGCDFVREVYGVPLEAPADLVIASCGGYPKDINVYQLQKTMDNASLAVREGGAIIIVGECAEGTGSDLYEEWMRKYKTPDRIEEELRKEFGIGPHKAFTVSRLMKKAHYVLLSGLDPQKSAELYFTPASTMEEALAKAEEKVGPDADIVLMPQGSLTVPIVGA